MGSAVAYSNAPRNADVHRKARAAVPWRLQTEEMALLMLCVIGHSGRLWYTVKVAGL